MLQLNVNQEKQLNFEIEIGGVETDQLDSFLRLEIDGVEYGFPAKIASESVTVDIPALKDITRKRLKEGQEVHAKLDIIVDGYYLKPWEDTFTLSNPLMAEAKIINSEYQPKAKLVEKTTPKTKKIIEEVVQQPTQRSEEDLTNAIVNKLAEKLMPVLNKRSKSLKESKVLKKQTPKKLNIKNITEAEVYNYMTRAGTSNPKIQELIYEQAIGAAKSGKPVKVLQQVVKLLKKGK